MNGRTVKALLFAAGVVALMFSAALKESGVPNAEVEMAASARADEGARGELSSLLLRDGWAALRAGRLDAAFDAATLSSFFGGVERSNRLFRSVTNVRESKVAALRRDISEARSIGDARRAIRLESNLAVLVGRGGPSKAAPREPEWKLARLIDDAKSHLDEGRHVQARASLTEALSLVPDDERAKRLMAELDRFSAEEEAGRVPEENVETEGMLREGMELKLAGEIERACLVFRNARLADRAAKAPGQFAASIEQALGHCRAELKRKYEPRLAEYEQICRASSTESAPKSMAELMEVRRGLDLMSKFMPEDSDLQKVEAELKRAAASTSRRWLAGAVAAESFSGCSKALPIYESIAAPASGAEAGDVEKAEEAMKRCRARDPREEKG